jgi:hypothetical protein
MTSLNGWLKLAYYKQFLREDYVENSGSKTGENIRYRHNLPRDYTRN